MDSIEIINSFKEIIPKNIEISLNKYSDELLDEKISLALPDSFKGKRKEEWIASRFSLLSIDETLDLKTLSFPHNFISLSHSKGFGFAAIGEKAYRGLGVDIEIERLPKEGSEKFFLTDVEQANIPKADWEESLLVYWSIKESVFKADQNNKGKSLLGYEVISIQKDRGIIRSLDENAKYEFFFLQRNTSVISLAYKVI